MDPLCVFKTADISNLAFLDKGGESYLYKGQLPTLENVAIKIYRAHNFTTKKEIEFLRTYPGHPNIVKLFGLLENDSLLVPGEWSGFVMEYMPCSLHDIIYEPSLLYAFDQIKSWIYQTSKGLEFMHSNGYLHRDIKPKNLLIGNNINLLKICDFGISKPYKDITLTAFIGTYVYMAPEVINGYGKRDAYGPSADVYSLAVTINEIVRRQRPYEHLEEMSNRNLLQSILENERPVLFEQEIDPTLYKLVKSSLSAQAEDRSSIQKFIVHTENSSFKANDLENKHFEEIKKFIEERKMGPRQNFKTVGKSKEEMSKTEKRKHTKFTNDQLLLPIFNISDFNIKKWIAAGIDSEILEADSICFGKVAIKLFDCECNNALYILSRLHHPNLIQIYGFVEENLVRETRLGIVMELFSTLSIEKIIAENQKVTKKEKYSWMLQASRAIAYIHSQGVVHQNIGPENFLLNKSKTHLKLAGFVIAAEMECAKKIKIARVTKQPIFLNHPNVDIQMFNILIFHLFSKSKISGNSLRKYLTKKQNDLVLLRTVTDEIKPIEAPIGELIERSLDTDIDKRPGAEEYVKLFEKKLEELDNQFTLSQLMEWAS